MTINEYNELYDQLCYGHESEILYNGNNFFIEWEDLKIILYNVIGDECIKIAEIIGKDRFSIVDKLFDLPLWNNTPLNKTYTNIEIIDIE